MIDFISKRAQKFNQFYIRGQVSEHKAVIDAAQEELYNIDNENDKVTFLRTILEENYLAHEEHQKECKHPESCGYEYDYESITYYLTQELNRLGIRTDNDQFTVEEKLSTDQKLDKILDDVQTLKYGQEVLYDELKTELEELKELYILGKKTWKQLLIGKTTEMVIGGIISEIAAKKIATEFIDEAQRLIS